MNRTRIALTVGLVALAVGIALFATSLRTPDDGREANVADAPAGGRTQAVPESALAPPIEDLAADPLLPGITEAPDIPASAAHRGLKKMGERIRDAVLADGAIGEDEVPGVTFLASDTQAQRRRFVEAGPDILCGCGCGQDLLECRRDDVNCPTSPAIRDSLLKAVREGG